MDWEILFRNVPLPKQIVKNIPKSKHWMELSLSMMEI